ncbi:MAG: CDP-diacylglycerol--glycerol-3-phosphate 3-phosphatidyltransferase [Christensenellales bacterium]|jgi:CDP-diacylglycerol--glycerol-3-phosphate 3-phosphatidyltransferase
MNTPNKLSLLRIILIPVFMFFYMATFIPYGKLIATVILILAEFTDFLDGYIARKYNLVTDLGKLLDPVADKSFSLAALLLISMDFIVPAPFGVIVLVIYLLRDFIVSALRQIAASKNSLIAADIFGKIKSFVLDISLPILFVVAFLKLDLGLANALGTTILYWIGLILLYASTLLSIYSGINYVVKNKEVLKDKK